MKAAAAKLFRILFIFVLFLSFSTAPSAPVQSSSPRAMVNAQGEAVDVSKLPTDQIIIKYRAAALQGPGMVSPASQDTMARLSSTAGVSLAYYRDMSGESNVLKLEKSMPLDQVRAIAGRLAALPEVEFAQPDAILNHTAFPNDPQYGNQWHYSTPVANSYGINAPEAWVATTGSASIVVAVVDTGIRNHVDLAGRILPGYDMISDARLANDGNGRDNDASDPGDWVTYADTQQEPFKTIGCPISNSSWHGTHVAGTIAANTNNGVGVAGINLNAKILPVRVLGKCAGYTSDIVDGVRWAAGRPVSGVPANPNPAKVINLSLGGYGACSASPIWQPAINEVVAAGTTVVVAAGNANMDASLFAPASCDNVITVAATNRYGYKAYYSNYGSKVEVAAPGGDTSVYGDGILSTLNTGTMGPVADSYEYYQGTSMAAPHVTGVVSLLYSVRPTLTPAQVGAILLNTATHFPGGSTCDTSTCGSGIVNAGAAVRYLVPISLIAPLYVKVVGGTETPYSGKVTYNGSAAPGQTVDLRYYNSASSTWSTYASVTTNATGDYAFNGVPAPTGGDAYYARWLNSAHNTSYLSGWWCDNVTASGGSKLCNIDIADVTHAAPAAGATVSLPYTFQWNKRSITSDHYFLSFYSYDGTYIYWEYDSPEQGWVSQWQMVTLPSSMLTSTLYLWEINILGTNGLGSSYYLYGMYFSNAGNPPQMNPDQSNQLQEMRKSDTLLKGTGPAWLEKQK